MPLDPLEADGAATVGVARPALAGLLPTGALAWRDAGAVMGGRLAATVPSEAMLTEGSPTLFDGPKEGSSLLKKTSRGF